MKKYLITILVVALLLVTYVPAFAANSKRATFALAGKITSIDGVVVTVNVHTGNKLVKSYIGTDLAITTTAATRFLLRVDGSVAQPISLADLEVGQNVSVNGKLANDVWTARRITANALLTHLP